MTRPNYINGAAAAIICTLDNNTCPLLNVHRIRFDCHGHFKDIDADAGMMLAPERSTIGQLASIACGNGKF